jgi:hypothetical protein
MPPLPFRRRPLIEELEPRLLYSADLAPLALDGLQPAPEQRVIVADGEYASQSSSVRHELVIVDTRVEGYETLLADILGQADASRRIEVATLDASRDGVEQISALLQRHSQLDALHLISHGESGSLQLGSSPLDSAGLDAHADAISAWSTALTADADLLLYGCDVAAGPPGEAFIGKLSQLTGADVAASTDATGSVAQGGDWALETQTGTVETTLLFGQIQTVWQGTLNINAEAAQYPANVTTTNDQVATPSSRQVAINPTDGSYVVVWTSNSQDGSGNGIYLRRFDSSGNVITGEIRVNSTTNNDQQAPAIAMDGDGDFIVVWESKKRPVPTCRGDERLGRLCHCLG